MRGGGGIAMPSGGEYNFRKKLWLPNKNIITSVFTVVKLI